MRRSVLSLFLISYCATVISQDSNLESFYTNFDKIVNLKNSTLSYGPLFAEKYARSKETHNYYETYQYTKGSVFYNGEYYPNVEIKYDLVDDQVIARILDYITDLSVTTGLSIHLENNLVDYFTINTTKFVNTKKHGYAQILKDFGQISLFKKFQKTKTKKLDKSYNYYSFKQRESYILKFKNEYYTVESKNDFYEIFPEQKKEIKQFFNEQRKLRKSYFEKFMIALCSKIENNL
ncbi:hypothetical protein [Tenacibaculum agarivorans]|uniref:hypothetical protein n=1 Tax=Tenacibaculum agarivorans TaxID=1908389 RepID=UPI00094BA1CD|nr:hypothetical protein [Tenacibaculum agarivorans]